MTSKQIKQAMQTGTAVAVLLALGVVVWGVASPAHVPEVGPADVRTARNPNNPSDDQADSSPTLQQLRALGLLELRRPLRDPPPIVVTAPPLSAKLVGTIYDANQPKFSMAIFILAGNKQATFFAGQTFNDPAGQVTVESVGDQTATVTYRGKTRELTAKSP